MEEAGEASDVERKRVYLPRNVGTNSTFLDSLPATNARLATKTLRLQLHYWRQT